MTIDTNTIKEIIEYVEKCERAFIWEYSSDISRREKELEEGTLKQLPPFYHKLKNKI